MPWGDSFDSSFNEGKKKIVRKADCAFQFLINLQSNLFSAIYWYFSLDFSQMLFQGFHLKKKQQLDFKITIIGVFSSITID